MAYVGVSVYFNVTVYIANMDMSCHQQKQSCIFFIILQTRIIPKSESTS